MQTETTSVRSHALAEQFEQANREVIEAVERCPEQHWRAVCAAEGWTVAVVAHHVGWAHAVVLEWAQSMAAGQGMPAVTMQEIDEVNRQHAEQHVSCTRTEMLALLRVGGAAAASAVRNMDDAALDRSAPVALLGGQVLSVEQLITRILIGHPRGHLASIASTLASI